MHPHGRALQEAMLKLSILSVRSNFSQVLSCKSHTSGAKLHCTLRLFTAPFILVSHTPAASPQHSVLLPHVFLHCETVSANQAPSHCRRPLPPALAKVLMHRATPKNFVLSRKHSWPAEAEQLICLDHVRTVPMTRGFLCLFMPYVCFFLLDFAQTLVPPLDTCIEMAVLSWMQR